MCSNKLKPLNLSGNARIHFYFWGSKDSTLEFKDFKNSDNCFDDFNLHLFAATEPQMILNDEKLQKKVDQNWSIAVETLYNCFIHLGLHEGYHYEKVFDKITLNNKDKYSNNIVYCIKEDFLSFLNTIKENIIKRTWTSKQINENMAIYVFEKNKDISIQLQICSSALYTRLFM
ncbi:uncharacterized protein LOC126909555 [Daktulosphaira vitifoliae]|uniref:uncharacterized protein LOC126909555 n=1 Tax=Daktulosphaira vitifoliae TaxID=58002 RepID=UPI0021AA3246|nr:uncharacterized protein LOC126909555 [Daktulosphaira vitifoliae]